MKLNITEKPEVKEYVKELEDQMRDATGLPRKLFEPAEVQISEYEQSIYDHVQLVRDNMHHFVMDICMRSKMHDVSKLKKDEFEVMEKTFPRLKTSTYGSQGYKDLLKEIKPALDLHYARNDHHPEHFENGVDDMNLFQIIEMLCNWKAAVEKHENGDIYESLEINRKRFGLSDQLYKILKNTIDKW